MVCGSVKFATAEAVAVAEAVTDVVVVVVVVAAAVAAGEGGRGSVDEWWVTAGRCRVSL